MPDQTPPPDAAKGGGKVKAILLHKLGPLPVVAWVALGSVGVLIAKRAGLISLPGGGSLAIGPASPGGGGGGVGGLGSPTAPGSGIGAPGGPGPTLPITGPGGGTPPPTTGGTPPATRPTVISGLPPLVIQPRSTALVTQPSTPSTGVLKDPANLSLTPNPEPAPNVTSSGFPITGVAVGRGSVLDPGAIADRIAERTTSSPITGVAVGSGSVLDPGTVDWSPSDPFAAAPGPVYDTPSSNVDTVPVGPTGPIAPGEHGSGYVTPYPTPTVDSTLTSGTTVGSEAVSGAVLAQ